MSSQSPNNPQAPYSSGIIFAPGETNIEVQQFSLSVVAFWLKSELGVTSTRLVAKTPHTLLGLIPLGSEDFAQPLPNIAGVGVNTRVYPWRIIWAIVFLIAMIVLFKNDQPVLGIIALIIAVVTGLNAMQAELSVQNNGGMVSYLRVSVLQQAKLKAFQEQVNQRLFADQSQLRHVQTTQLQQQQLMAQQLNNQFMQQNFSQPQAQAQQFAAPAPAPAASAGAAVPPPPGAPAAPADAHPAGWHADPHGRFAYRYHDGQNWTENVSNGGAASTDPI